MALQKTKVCRTGASGNYWRITQHSLDTTTRKASYKISLFKDAAASAAGNRPMHNKWFEFTLTTGEMADDLIELGYVKIKDKAETMVHPVSGSVHDLVEFDPDLANAVDV